MRCRVISVLLLLTFPLSLFAQEKPFSAQINVTAIEVTAQVLDANGNTPPDLKPSDFVIVEDGVERPVRSLEYMSGATSAATVSGTPAAIAAAPAAAAAPKSQVWDVVIYVDMELSGRRTIKDALKALQTEADHFTKLGNVEVVVADPSPRRLAGPTTDAAAVRAALATIEKMTPADRLTTVRKEFLADVNGNTQKQAGQTHTSGVSESRSSVNAEGMLIQTFLTRMGQWLGGYNRDNAGALFLVSDGYDVDPSDFYAQSFDAGPSLGAPDVRAQARAGTNANPRNIQTATGRMIPGSQNHDASKLAGEAMASVRRSFDTFARDAASAGWTIMALRGGLSGTMSDDAATSGGMRATNFTNSQLATTSRPGGTIQVNSKDPLSGMADATGGSVESNPAKFAQAIDSLTNRIRLTYEVSRPADGKLRSVDVRTKRAGLRVNATKWASSSTPELIATSRASALIGGSREKGELVTVAKLDLDKESDKKSVDKGTLETRVSLAPLEALRPQLTASTLRLTIAVNTADDRPSIQHQLLTGYDLSKMKELTIAIPMQLADRSKNVAVLVEELSTGAWGGALIPLNRANKEQRAFASAGWTERQVEAFAWTNWNDALTQAQKEKKLIVAYAGPAGSETEKLFDNGAVRARAGGYVVTRLDPAAAQTLGVGSGEHIVLLDQGGRMRYDWKAPAATELAGRLVQIRSVAPSLLRAGDLLATNADSADAHFALGFAYLRTERFNDAKNEYQTAQRLATAAGNAELAQRSEIQAAAATAQAGDRKTAMTSLEKVTRSPATPLTEAEAWLILGHLRKAGGDPKGSLDAYSRAASRAPQGSELQRIATSLVAQGGARTN